MEAQAALLEGDLHDILDCRFRANPAFRLVEQAELPADQRPAFAGLADDPDHFGMLVPEQGTALGILAVDRQAARLFADLREPGPLPDALVAGSRTESNRRVALLVLDGVLEIERDGAFRCGPRAHADLLPRAFEAPRPKNRIARLSHDVLRRAQAVPIADARKLCSWIYSSGALPIGPEAAARFSGPEAVDRIVGLEAESDLRRELSRHYRHSTLSGWSAWHRDVDPLRYVEPGGTRTAYKLYVSPQPRALGEAFGRFAECLLERPAPAFKLGRDAYGLFRPDKLMVYFDELEPLERFAHALLPKLAGCPAHGVPFTAALDDDGLLSWGVDPPRSHRIPGWKGSESWRAWLAARLARAILRARAAPAGEAEPWVCALDRIRVEGIDPDRWLPTRDLWAPEDEA